MKLLGSFMAVAVLLATIVGAFVPPKGTAAVELIAPCKNGVDCRALRAIWAGCTLSSYIVLSEQKIGECLCPGGPNVFGSNEARFPTALRKCINCVEKIVAAGFLGDTVLNSALDIYDDYCASAQFGSGPSISQFIRDGAKLNEKTGFPIVIPNGTSYEGLQLNGRDPRRQSYPSVGTTTAVSKSFVVVAPSSTAEDTLSVPVLTSSAVSSLNTWANFVQARGFDGSDGRNVTFGLIKAAHNATSIDHRPTDLLATVGTVPPLTLSTVTPDSDFSSGATGDMTQGTTANFSTLESVFLNSSTSAAERKTAVAQTDNTDDYDCSEIVSPATHASEAPALDITTFPRITSTLTSTSTYTRTVEITLISTATESGPGVCKPATVFVTITGGITASVPAPSTTSHVTDTPNSGSSKPGAPQAAGISATGDAVSDSKSSRPTILTGTYSASTKADISKEGGSSVVSATTRTSVSSSSIKNASTQSVGAMPSSSPFLTPNQPNQPNINSTVAGTLRTAKSPCVTWLFFLFTVIGGLVLFAI